MYQPHSRACGYTALCHLAACRGMREAASSFLYTGCTCLSMPWICRAQPPCQHAAMLPPGAAARVIREGRPCHLYFNMECRLLQQALLTMLWHQQSPKALVVLQHFVQQREACAFAGDTNTELGGGGTHRRCTSTQKTWMASSPSSVFLLSAKAQATRCWAKC